MSKSHRQGPRLTSKSWAGLGNLTKVTGFSGAGWIMGEEIYLSLSLSLSWYEQNNADQLFLAGHRFSGADQV